MYYNMDDYKINECFNLNSPNALRVIEDFCFLLIGKALSKHTSIMIIQSTTQRKILVKTIKDVAKTFINLGIIEVCNDSFIKFRNGSRLIFVNNAPQNFHGRSVNYIYDFCETQDADLCLIR